MLVIIFLFCFLCNSLLHLNFGRPLQVHTNYCDTSVKMLAGHIKTYQNNINIGVGPSEEASADAPAQGFHLAYWLSINGLDALFQLQGRSGALADFQINRLLL